MSQAFEDWWVMNRAWNLMTKDAGLVIWNAAIEYIRTTEPMPVNERILATLLRIESKMPTNDDNLQRIRRAQQLEWLSITQAGEMWFGLEPVTMTVKEIPL